jgi:hypothetical protein
MRLTIFMILFFAALITGFSQTKDPVKKPNRGTAGFTAGPDPVLGIAKIIDEHWVHIESVGGTIKLDLTRIGYDSQGRNRATFHDPYLTTRIWPTDSPEWTEEFRRWVTLACHINDDGTIPERGIAYRNYLKYQKDQPRP